MLKQVEIYTDGACSGNPGAGGWSAILSYKGVEKEISGGERETTNNRMELLAVINGLKMLKEKCEVKVYSDSQYVVSAFNEGWINSWIMAGWRTADKKPVKNNDLWKRLVELTTVHSVEFIKVKGHADNVKNNRCDYLARSEIEKLNSKQI
ncbi:MAG: ribonuclease HI [Clostridia bacterium]|nr:ribonuclease HI [Clostridia bacterium]